MKTIIMFASTRKEAYQFMMQDYKSFSYVGVYKRVSRGNTFYEFNVPE